jgi:hypothetical protein
VVRPINNVAVLSAIFSQKYGIFTVTSFAGHYTSSKVLKLRKKSIFRIASNAGTEKAIARTIPALTCQTRDLPSNITAQNGLGPNRALISSTVLKTLILHDIVPRSSVTARGPWWERAWKVGSRSTEK